MQTFQFVAILAHILAAAIWIGGMVFLGVVLIPVLRGRAAAGQYGELMHRTGVRFRSVGWACLLVLVVSGLVNLTRWGVDPKRLLSPELWATPWGRILGLKLALVVTAITLSGVHDFIIGPRATARLRESPNSDEVRKLRRAASWMGRANLLIALLIVALGVMLVRGLPV